MTLTQNFNISYFEQNRKSYFSESLDLTNRDKKKIIRWGVEVVVAWRITVSGPVPLILHFGFWFGT